MRWALACVLVVACRGGGSARVEEPAPFAKDARIVSLRMHDRSDGVPRDLSALSQHAASTLVTSGPLAVAVGAERRARVDYQLDVEVRIEHGVAGKRALMRAVAGATLERIAAPLGEAPIVAEAMGERDDAANAGEDPVARAARERDLLEHVLDDALKLLAAEAHLHTSDAPALVAALTDAAAPVEVRAEAVRVAGERKERLAVAPLCKLVESDDARLGDLAIGGLVAIGDRAAVRPLTHAARMRDVNQLPKIIDAAGALGGDEARSFLTFIAASHASPNVRELAEEALGRMDRRAEPAP